MSPIPDAQHRAPSPATETAPFEVFCSRHFTGWLAEERLSLAFTTYQAGKLFLIGLDPAARLSIFNRTVVSTSEYPRVVPRHSPDLPVDRMPDEAEPMPSNGHPMTGLAYPTGG